MTSTGVARTALWSASRNASWNASRNASRRAFRHSCRSDRAGVALVVVLWLIVLLATATAVAGNAARTSSRVAANTRAQSTARAMAESGIIAAASIISDSLQQLTPNDTQRQNFLLSLEPQLANALPFMQDTLAGGVFAVTIVDVSARLDVNSAGVEGLTKLLTFVTTPENARRIATDIDNLAHTAVNLDPELATARARRDSIADALLGRSNSPRLLQPIQTLNALQDIPGMDIVALEKVAAFLTVDGNGQINRRAASREVLASASGSLVDAPSRLLIIARGWYVGHPLTRQIEAVYDVADNGLRLVRWRETDL